MYKSMFRTLGLTKEFWYVMGYISKRLENIFNYVSWFASIVLNFIMLNFNAFCKAYAV